MSKPSGGWKRFLSVGCSHGFLADPEALKATLKFKRAWKPHRTFHLGDFMDVTAFRGGARGTSDEAVQLKPDLVHGLNYLRELEPTDILLGNHEIRLWKMAQHYNAIVSKAAQDIIDDIQKVVDDLGANYLNHYDINRSWIQLADTKFLHGFMYNENAIRDHAEHFGKCVIAHLHTAGEVAGRRADHARAWCVGTLANIAAMGYANTHRSTSRWSHGFVYGEYNDEVCHPLLSQAPPNQAGAWRLPL